MKKITKDVFIALFSVIIALVSVFGAVYSHYLINRWGKYDEGKVFSIQIEEGEDDFRILQLTDTHISDVSQLDYMKRSIQELVDRTNPNLIVVTGDGIWKKTTGAVLPEYAEVLDSFGINWAYIFGNHDFEGSATLEDYQRVFSQSQYGLFDVGPDNIKGNCNYAINIKDGKDVVYSLIMLDSHGRGKKPKGKRWYEHIRDEQVDWYEWNIRGVSEYQYGKNAVARGKTVPSLLFYHIPQLEFMEERLETLKKYGINTSAPDGSIATETDDDVATDIRLYPAIRSKLVERAAKLGSTKAMFVGHLHRDRSHYNHKGIELVQGTKTLTTYSYYGYLEGEAETKIGGNIITVSKNGDYNWERVFSTIIEPEYRT